MRLIRGRIILLSVWITLSYITDRLLDPIDFGLVTGVLMLAMIIIVLAATRLGRIHLTVFLAAPIFALVAIKIWIGELSGSVDVPLTVMEGFILAVTTFLAYQVSLAITEFESAVVHFTIGHPSKSPEPLSTGQGTLYREVRRARNHQRPLALIAVAVEENSSKVALETMVRETQQAMMKQYILSSVSNILCEKLEDCDVIVQNNDNFLVMLPEATPGDLPGLITRLREQVHEQLGVDLKIGVASLPKDGFTLEGLVEKAIQELNEDQKASLVVELDQLHAKKPVSIK